MCAFLSIPSCWEVVWINKNRGAWQGSALKAIDTWWEYLWISYKICLWLHCVGGGGWRAHHPMTVLKALNSQNCVVQKCAITLYSVFCCVGGGGRRAHHPRIMCQKPWTARVVVQKCAITLYSVFCCVGGGGRQANLEMKTLFVCNVCGFQPFERLLFSVCVYFGEPTSTLLMCFPTSSRVCKVSIFQLRHSPFFTWFVLRFTSFS